MKHNRLFPPAVLVTLAVFFTASTLRSPITSLGALSLDIQSDLGFSSGAIGLLTTLPLLVFAASSVFVSTAANRFGKRRMLAVGMAIIAAGILLRSFADSAGLFAGTILLSIGISCGNVLLPAVVKEIFPLRIGAMTAMYTTTMCIFAGGFAGTVSTLSASGKGWKTALALTAPLAAVAALLWMASRPAPRAIGKQASEGSMRHRKERVFHRRILANPLTWWLTGLFGLQSILFYCSVAWVPSILASRGIEGGTVALCVMLFPVMGIPCSMLIPPLAQRMQRQRLLGAAIGACCALGAILVWLASSDATAVISVAIFGLALGAPFSLCMFYFGYRTENAADSSRLSSISQTFGYLFAAAGPTFLGILHDTTLSWDVPLGVMLVLACGIAICGWKTGSGKIAAKREQGT